MSNETKDEKTMKKRPLILCAAAALFVIGMLTLTGCGSSNEPGVNAEATVSAAIDSFKAGDFDGFYSHVNLTDEAASEVEDEEEAALYKMLGSQVTYKIVSSEEDLKEGTATVTVEVTHPAIQAIYDRALEIADEEEIDGTKLTDKEAQAKSAELFEQAVKEVGKGNPTTDTVKVELGLVEKADGTYEWKITNEVLYEPLFGGDIAE